MSSAQFVLRMRPYFRQVAGELVLGSICGIFMNTAVVLPALLLGRAIDEVLRLSRGESTPQAVTLAALLVVAGTLATEVPRMGKRWWLMTANARIRGSVRADVFRGVVAWPMARLHRTPIGDIMARTVGDVEVLGVGVREFTIEMWDTVLFSISILVTMLFLDPGLTVLALLPVALAMLLARASGPWIADRTTRARRVNADVTAAIQEQLAGVRLLRLFGRRSAAVAQVRTQSEHQAEANLATHPPACGPEPRLQHAHDGWHRGHRRGGWAERDHGCAVGRRIRGLSRAVRPIRRAVVSHPAAGQFGPERGGGVRAPGAVSRPCPVSGG